MEKSLVLIKPDAMERELAGAILSRLQTAGMKLAAVRMLHLDKDMAERHYAIHREKPFFNDLVRYITSSPIVAAVFAGDNAVEAIRKIMGPTDPGKAGPAPSGGISESTSRRTVSTVPTQTKTPRRRLSSSSARTKSSFSRPPD